LHNQYKQDLAAMLHRSKSTSWVVQTDQEKCWRCTQTLGCLPCQTRQSDSALCSTFAWTEINSRSVLPH